MSGITLATRFRKVNEDKADEMQVLLVLEDLVEIHCDGYLDKELANKCKRYLNGKIIELRRRSD